MKVKTTLELMFSAAVHLPNDSGPKKRMHGHNYRVAVTVDGEADEAALVKLVQEAALDVCDHQTLNDFIADPTCANVARWFWERLSPKLPALAEVALWQTPELCVRVTGP